MSFRFWLFLCLALLSLPPLTDWLVARQFHRSIPVGYSRQDRDAMTRLVERSVTASVILARDTGTAHATQGDCGENWLCLLQWASEQHPTRKRRQS